MDYHEIITIEPDKRSGKPCIRGTRMTVTDVLEYLAGGMTHQELLAEFPDLKEEDIRACLAFVRPIVNADWQRFPHEVAVRPESLPKTSSPAFRPLPREYSCAGSWTQGLH